MRRYLNIHYQRFGRRRVTSSKRLEKQQLIYFLKGNWWEREERERGRHGFVSMEAIMFPLLQTLLAQSNLLAYFLLKSNSPQPWTIELIINNISCITYLYICCTEYTSFTSTSSFLQKMDGVNCRNWQLSRYGMNLTN